MPSSRFSFNRELVIRVFFFTAFAFLLYQLFLLAHPFMPSIVVAAMLVITFYPLYMWVLARVKNQNLAASILTAAVVLAAVLPLLGVAWLVVHESDRLIPTVQGFLESLHSGELISVNSLPPFLQAPAERLSAIVGNFSIDPKLVIMENIQTLGDRLAIWGSLVARNAVFTFFKILILIFSMFFIFRDGHAFFRWLVNIIPMEQSHKEDLARSAYETFRAVSIGVFLTSAGQGAVAFIGFLIAGVRLPLFLALATMMTSLLGASSLITIPVGLVMLKASTGKGIFLLIWGALVVGLLDNWLRPVLIGTRARMPFFLVFFSILGGLKMYGLLGIILGPILVASVMTFIRLYREAYVDERNV